MRPIAALQWIALLLNSASAIAAYNAGWDLPDSGAGSASSNLLGAIMLVIFLGSIAACFVWPRYQVQLALFGMFGPFVVALLFFLAR